MIKSVKRAIYAVLGQTNVNDEELQTVFYRSREFVEFQTLNDSQCQ